MELPKRKPTRLKNYDYSTPGAYFVTICAGNRRCIFSDIIVGAIHESPVLKLKTYGIIADNVIKKLNSRFDVEISKYVIMPNHIHMLIVITDSEILRAIRESPLRGRSLVSKVVGYMKMNISKEIHKINPDEKLWQRSFHDHIIRNQKDYDMIWEYIDTNVLRWEKDCFYVNGKDEIY
ncbi:MAG: transposase [Clostridia bacterium]|nr:transposase [Clostridia bacterium]